MSLAPLKVINTMNNINIVNVLNDSTIPNSTQISNQSPPPSPSKRSFRPSNPPFSKSAKNTKQVTIKVNLEVPPEVNTDGLVDCCFDIMQLSDLYDLMFAYNIVNAKGLYQNIKDKNYRWIFFSDEYEIYEREESGDLMLDPVFNQKWYRGKYMTVFTLDNNLKYGKYILPATKQEYSEDKEIYARLYQIMRKNDSTIGKYVKNKKM